MISLFLLPAVCNTASECGGNSTCDDGICKCIADRYGSDCSSKKLFYNCIKEQILSRSFVWIIESNCPGDGKCSFTNTRTEHSSYC